MIGDDLLGKLIKTQNRESLSDAAFARRLGVSRQLWQAVKSDRRKVSLSLLKAVARQFPELERDVVKFLKEAQ
ncbi:MAG: hypothetical protein CO064_03555 [Anaerolineae bacterium CG_4_9_14_0_8_um_filter_58_9]|nr:MAG: hypothetical protein CO064_03555 [Anaerolineae bacterium CG_4_9_14_0_8_um_filter_58_9]